MLYLGGPLTFLPDAARELRPDAGRARALCPENSLLFRGAWARRSTPTRNLDLRECGAKRLHDYSATATIRSTCRRCFATKQEYEAFHARHCKADACPRLSLVRTAPARCISASTPAPPPSKLVVIDEDDNLLFTSYQSKPAAIPSRIVQETLHRTFTRRIRACRWPASPPPATARTLSRSAFRVDFGVVETVAHFTAAKHFMPDVRFHHRHRRAGHEVLQDRGRCHQQHLPERGLLLRLRQLFADVCRARWATASPEFAEAGPVCRQARWTWAAAARCS